MVATMMRVIMQLTVVQLLVQRSLLEALFKDTLMPRAPLNVFQYLTSRLSFCYRTLELNERLLRRRPARLLVNAQGTVEDSGIRLVGDAVQGLVVILARILASITT